MTKSWLIRSLPNGINRIDEFLENNFIAIGWPGLNDLKNTSKEGIKKLLQKPPFSLQSLSLGSTYGSIDIFVNQIQKDDFVLVPDTDDIYLGIVTGDYFFVNNLDSKEIGYAHQRKVKWLKKVKRDELPDQLRNSLRAPRAVANLGKYTEIISALALGNEIIPTGQDEWVSTTYPLRNRLNIEIKIPYDMTRVEAERLGEFVKTLYFEN